MGWIFCWKRLVTLHFEFWESFPLYLIVFSAWKICNRLTIITLFDSNILLLLSLFLNINHAFVSTLHNYNIYTTHITILNLQCNIYILAILDAYNFIPYFNYLLYRLLWLTSVLFSTCSIVKYLHGFYLLIYWWCSEYTAN